MRLLIIANFLAAIALQSLAAPVDTHTEAGPSTNTAQSSGGTSEPAVPEPATENMEGKVMGWSDTISTHGPPTFQAKKPTEYPTQATGQKTQRWKNNLKKPHPYIIIKDHGQYVGGVTSARTHPPGDVVLPKTAQEYGIMPTAAYQPTAQKPSKIRKKIVYAAKERLHPRPPTVATDRLSQEDLDKLRADLCKRGLGGSCSLRTSKKSATTKPAKSLSMASGSKIAKVGNKSPRRKLRKSISLESKSQKKTAAINHRVPQHKAIGTRAGATRARTTVRKGVKGSKNIRKGRK